MKKLIFTMSIVLISILGYSQVTSVGEFRVATATTDFGVNLPIGTKVYNIATGDYWVATAGVGSGEDLTSASASFTKLNDSGTDDQTATEVGVTATGNLASENVQDALEELQGDIDGISDTDDQTAAEVNITDTDGDYTSTNVEGALAEIGDSIAAHRTDIDANTTAIAAISDTDDQTATEVNITDSGGDYTSTNVEGALAEVADSIAAHRTDIDQNATDIATNASAIADISDTDDQTASEVNITDAGEYYTGTTVEAALQESGADISTNAGNISTNTSNIATNVAAIALNTAKETNVSTALSTGTVDETSYGIDSDGGDDDVILAAATNSTAGVMTAAQVTKLEGIATGAQVNLTLWTEKFEEDDGTATEHGLEQTAVLIQGAIVTLNGVRLAPDKYTFTTSTLTIGVPVYQYDQVIITYSVLNPVF